MIAQWSLGAAKTFKACNSCPAVDEPKVPCKRALKDIHPDVSGWKVPSALQGTETDPAWGWLWSWGRCVGGSIRLTFLSTRPEGQLRLPERVLPSNASSTSNLAGLLHLCGALMHLCQIGKITKSQWATVRLATLVPCFYLPIHSLSKVRWGWEFCVRCSCGCWDVAEVRQPVLKSTDQ